jgi:hypothetical protein
VFDRAGQEPAQTGYIGPESACGERVRRGRSARGAYGSRQQQSCREQRAESR